MQSNSQKRKRDSDSETDNLILLANESSMVAAVADKKGKRYTMEDTHINTKLCSKNSNKTVRIFAVCDGHGGTSCSKFLQQYLAQYVANNLCYVDPNNAEKVSTLIQQAFAQCEAAFEQQKKVDDDSGSTCCMIIYFETERLFYIANCGDSRAILFEKLVVPLKPIQITTDHKPDVEIEKKRIIAAGGTVVRNENWFIKTVYYRVNNILAVARSFGDVFLRPMITEKPDVFGPFHAQKDTAVLLACDGAFEANTTEQLGEAIQTVLLTESTVERSTRHSTPDTRRVMAIVRDVCCFAYDNGSTDNITSICVQFLK